MAVQHGKRTTYVRGCRCEACKEANRQYGIDLKERKRSGGTVVTPLRSLSSLPAMPPPPEAEKDPDEIGRNELAVAAEIRTLSSASKHPGLVESALSMAKILDNPIAVTTHPSAQRQLMVALDKLHAASTKRKDSNLAKVAQMAVRGGPQASIEKAADA